MFKKFFTTACLISALTCSALAGPPLNKIRSQFVEDVKNFEFDREFFDAKDKEIVSSYNADKGTSVADIVEVPRSYYAPIYKSLHTTNKMICASQCIYYLDLFKKAGIKAHIIHIQLFNPETGESDGTHDDLIFYDAKNKCWKVIDFTGAWKCFQSFKRKMAALGLSARTLSADQKRVITDFYFDKNLTDLLGSIRHHAVAVTYYVGDDQKDLGELDPKLNSCLKQYAYPYATVEGRSIRFSERV